MKHLKVVFRVGDINGQYKSPSVAYAPWPYCTSKVIFFTFIITFFTLNSALVLMVSACYMLE